MALTAAGAVYGVQWLDALIFGGGRREAYVRSAATQAEPALQAVVTADGLGLSWRLWRR